MRIATWNVNSIRARAERVVSWLERSEVDVLLVQETKVKDELFPSLLFEAAGYEVAFHGVNQWNGVAIISRVGIADVERGFAGAPTWGDPPVAEARAIGATCAGLRLWSVYVPNGRTLADPHYAYKLDWLAALREQAAVWAAAGAPLALMGDWNVAPLDEDVWDMAVFDGATHVSAPEREAFAAFAEAGLTEVTREHAPGKYTYWDYQRLRFPRNEGMRIDFAWANPTLAERVHQVWIDREERKGKGPSDHVPVVLELAAP
ncbi:MAG TPA: exodeoxyribonuclease III [Candidatus Ruania gallistercoris]|uniref:Exodeoxyribonuclease III n=1 Tax=Candidatus Ruania gallistercoris TaxID=2838746 RepID=A0A9D2EHM7_9MICO|nr:exodeoxyribonuclease III [Candidatus Ruania gallistercoris]